MSHQSSPSSAIPGDLFYTSTHSFCDVATIWCLRSSMPSLPIHFPLNHTLSQLALCGQRRVCGAQQIRVWVCSVRSTTDSLHPMVHPQFCWFDPFPIRFLHLVYSAVLIKFAAFKINRSLLFIRWQICTTLFHYKYHFSPRRLYFLGNKINVSISCGDKDFQMCVKMGQS